MQHGSKHIRSLEGCINDLISLLALPAMWSGCEPPQVLGILLDVLMRMLCLDFVYTRLNLSSNASGTEMCRTAGCLDAADSSARIGLALHPWVEGDDKTQTTVVINPFGPGRLRVAFVWVGLGRERGVIAAASSRGD
ncbi:MAG: hypothetical protein ACU841_01160, partial [Gammaproteobacteria bacterium]